MTEDRPTVPSVQTLDWHAGDMPYSREFDDHFYCRADGRLECGHVFLAGNGLPHRFSSAASIAIGELGFGTGLNLCETWRQWKATRKAAGARLTFTSFERFPMQAGDIDRALSPWTEIAKERETLVRLWPREPAGTLRVELDEDVSLRVVCGVALEQVAVIATTFDAWYLDGFAPARNPDMWSVELMEAVYRHTAEGGTFATYAAAGFVRRNLQAAGFQVERRPGFAGKREMLCGIKRRSSLPDAVPGA